jgi:tRNA(Ile)-lysidine synthase
MRLVNIPAGKYIVAVSGGVDSMAMLDMLRRQSELELVVVHVNHGMRDDAGEDEKTTRLFCMSHNISFISKKLHLGKNASEERARKARYDVLQHCRITEKAFAILTAHHQDDLVETALINLLRGTGWRGLAPFTQPSVTRPLLNMTKQELVEYAKKQHVPWRDDPTNSQQQYLRNYVRLSLVPRLTKQSKTWRSELLRLIRNQQQLRRTIEGELNKLICQESEMASKTAVIARYSLIMLPHSVAYELLQAIFRKIVGNSLQRQQAESVLLFAKVALPGKQMPLGAWRVRVTKRDFIVESSAAVVS